MANEFLPGTTLKAGVTGQVIKSSDYNANLGTIATNSVIGVTPDGAPTDFAVGSTTKVANGAYVNAINMRQGSLVNFYNASNVFQNSVNIGQASETLAGSAEIATQAEVNAGTDDLRFVTPLKLANNILISVDRFTAAGTFTWNRPANCRSIIVVVTSAQGGGGGGGGATGTTIAGDGISITLQYLINSPPASVILTNGLGGGGGQRAGNTANWASSGGGGAAIGQQGTGSGGGGPAPQSPAGGITSFGAFITLPCGAGGKGCNTSTNNIGGKGGDGVLSIGGETTTAVFGVQPTYGASGTLSNRTSFNPTLTGGQLLSPFAVANTSYLNRFLNGGSPTINTGQGGTQLNNGVDGYNGVIFVYSYGQQIQVLS